MQLGSGERTAKIMGARFLATPTMMFVLIVCKVYA